MIHCLSVSCMKINLSRCALVIRSSLQLTSKQRIIIQQFTARADLIFKLKKIKIFQYTSIVFLSILDIYIYTRYGYSSIGTDSPKTSLFAYTEYGCRGRLRPNFRFLANWVRHHEWLIETFWAHATSNKILCAGLYNYTYPVMCRYPVGLWFCLSLHLRTNGVLCMRGASVVLMRLCSCTGLSEPMLLAYVV